jgi:hypothetical protein
LYLYRRRRRVTGRSMRSKESDEREPVQGGSLLSVYTATDDTDEPFLYGFSKNPQRKGSTRPPVRLRPGLDRNESLTTTSSESMEFLDVDEEHPILTDEEINTVSSAADDDDDDDDTDNDTDTELERKNGTEYYAPLGVPLSGHDRRRSSSRSKFESDMSASNQTPNTYAYDDDDDDRPVMIDDDDDSNSITGEFVSSDDDYRTTGTSDTSGAYSGMPSLASMNSAPIRVDIYAPVGKLGLVIETADHGVPVIHSVHPTSPVVDQVFPGDELIAVDDQDITGMTAMDVSRLLAYKTSTKVSKWTLLRSVRRFAGSVQSDSTG